jgi:release factor glutamine methyltransferase
VSAAGVPPGAVELRVPRGVFAPRSDARLLARAMAASGLLGGARVLEPFTGSGALALAAAALGARAVTAVDVSWRAVMAARCNASRNGLRVRVLHGDLFAPVDGERFDLIIANPPYLPGDAALPRRGPRRAWEGGADGRTLIDRLCAQAPSHLEEGGSLMMVHSSLCGERPTRERLAAVGLRAEVLARERGPLGPLACARLAELAARGLLGGDDEPSEELLVICAR